MRKRALRKNSIREIGHSFGRYFAILSIVALGVGLYSGLQVTKDAMIETCDKYYRKNSLYDFRLVSTLGLTDENVDSVVALDFVKDAEGTYSTDALVGMPDNSTSVARIHAISDRINKVTVLGGCYPKSADECLVDSRWFSSDIIGKKITLSDINEEDTLDMFSEKEFTVSGICKASYYINFERGNTTLGNGKLSGFIYVLPESFDTECFTEMFVTTKASGYRIYSDEYETETDYEEDLLEEKLTELAKARYDGLYSDAKKELDDAEAELIDAKEEIGNGEKEIADGREEILLNESRLSDGWASYYNGVDNLETMKDFMPVFMYEENLKILENSKQELLDAGAEIEDAKKEIEEAEKEIADAKSELIGHEADLENARKELSKLEEPDTYVLSRDTNIGYACFENDSAIVEGIGNVFPVFFFLVAALVCMTTMNRMVEEKRTEIGTMKALGYSEASIMGKYLFYSGSAAITGCVGGYFAGLKVFPYVIWDAYKIMYTIDEIVFIIDVRLGIVSLIVSAFCSMGATYFTLVNELRDTSSNLIRPKAPANGKRVFLENVKFIWKRLSFTAKVSVRNVFRYQKRFWMMILGVGGCYGLLITGMGIKDSIADVCDCQFNNIQRYDMTVTFSNDSDYRERDEFEGYFEDNQDYLYAETKTVDVDAGGKIKSATMVAFSDEAGSAQGSDFINFTDDEGKPIELPKDGEAIINSKMAKLLGIKVGDEIVLRDPDLKETRVTVSGIMRNYVYNWAYINAETYRGTYNDTFYNTAFAKTRGESYQFGAKVGKLDYVSSVTVTDEMSKRIDNMMSSLNEVVLLVILCAAALAFIVMYNLTNINITERVREIATLKVLGFYLKETALYVFRENLVLTALGLIPGLFMGYALHRFVMMNITVEAVSFDTKILPQSYLWGIILTFLFALTVDFILSFKLSNINMAESLKSAE